MHCNSRFNKNGQSRRLAYLRSVVYLHSLSSAKIWPCDLENIAPREIRIWLDEAACLCRICSLLEAHAIQWSCFLLSNPRQGHLLCNEIRQHAHTFLLCSYPLRVGHLENVWQRKCHAVWLSVVKGTNQTPLSDWGNLTHSHTFFKQHRCTVCLVHKHLHS